jgi:hypothetical protein
MSHLQRTIDQTLIPVSKGIITGLLLTLSVMLGVKQIHINAHERLSVAVESPIITTEGSSYE